MTTTEKVKHTSGPWTHEGDDHNPGRKIFAAGWYTVADVHDYDTAEGMANARLIAASPEMLSALEGVVSTYVFLESMTAGQEPMHTNSVDALERVRAAIRRAKGE